MQNPPSALQAARNKQVDTTHHRRRRMSWRGGADRLEAIRVVGPENANDSEGEHSAEVKEKQTCIGVGRRKEGEKRGSV
jgi:hypothetical protein